MGDNNRDDKIGTIPEKNCSVMENVDSVAPTRGFLV